MKDRTIIYFISDLVSCTVGLPLFIFDSVVVIAAAAAYPRNGARESQSYY